MARFVGTSAPLAGNGTFTASVRVEQEDYISLLVKTDQAGNIFIDQSVDGGANWDLSETQPVVAGTVLKWRVDLYASTIQVRFVNGATPQTFLRLGARLGSAGYR
jgi:hypothetical protein